MKRAINKIHVVKIAAFLLIFTLLLECVTDILKPKWLDGTAVTAVSDQFYEEEKDSIEVGIIGNSQSTFGISSMRLLDRYGISAYSLATGLQPMLCSYFYLKEMVKTQKSMKTVIFDVTMLYHEEEERTFRNTIDSAPMSFNKLWIILEHSDYPFAESGWTYLFPIMRYHSRWDELKKKDYGYQDVETGIFKGNNMSSEVSRKIDYEELCLDDDKLDKSVVMDESELFYFTQMVNYCKEENIDLILIKTPRLDWSTSQMSGVEALAEEYGLPYIDFNTSENLKALGIDVTKDFWNQDHLNVRGADKLTDYMAEYLLARDTYTDGRQTAAYREEEVQKYQIDRENKYLQSSVTLEDAVEELQNDRYEIIMQLTGNLSAHWNEEYQKLLETIGVSVNPAELKESFFVGQYKNGACVYQKDNSKKISYKGKFSDGAAVEVTCDPSLGVGKIAATIAGEKISYNKKGLNISVYDTVNGKLVDNFTLFYDKEGKSFRIYRKK